jgi:hypothetical protein
VGDAILEALEKDPADRPQSASDFIALVAAATSSSA